MKTAGGRKRKRERGWYEEGRKRKRERGIG
jgi:hypothetical protein